ncbi:FAD-binding domain-containing protein [Lutimonas zeaxanthinifaciens]|uniref:FAD-binding domain-containing protein n=1 Tax=Lutimonas zeaxanthinifaciens TaxID=3060215 RepID=UPI00265CCF6A|nr:FAD-binding domain-containing protein [Lutimonas sp. YSD2104]WKK67176.1 FAD-binding domain-containing protein [Lutimonas sp. YSD2104]
MEEIKDRILQIDPVAYASTRNYKNGKITKLSPYISRGVISTRFVFDQIMNLGLPWNKIEKLVQELAWRDYWQQVWKARGNDINKDLKRKQESAEHFELPVSIMEGTTGIEAIDKAVSDFYDTGYMHNHMRMYVAALACNVGRSHWLNPARWMYYNLLDGDWASNALSWQWVAGSNANKKYYANQDNINRYFSTDQKGTFLDISYDKFDELDIPEELSKTQRFEGATDLSNLPELKASSIDKNRKTLLYNYYNLDPNWHQDEDYQRVLLMEPSFFRQYPVSRKCIEFSLQLAENIEGVNVYVGEFEELKRYIKADYMVFKEHPTNHHYEGKEEPREWMFEVEGYFSSFFGFWKKCKKHIRK